jgi:hypothetical protein
MKHFVAIRVKRRITDVGVGVYNYLHSHDQTLIFFGLIYVVDFYGGSGFSAAIQITVEQTNRGWKAAPTPKAHRYTARLNAYSPFNYSTSQLNQPDNGN